MFLARGSGIFERIAAAAVPSGRTVRCVALLPTTTTAPRITPGPLALLYHGTDSVGVEGITTAGAIHPSTGSGLELGRGVYLTPHASMALWYCKDSATLGPLVACEARLGVVAYEKDDEGGDSVVGFVDGMSMYCVKDPRRVVPRYLVFFEKL